jgi:hypothetical protein
MPANVPNAQVVSLTVRPIQSVNLCFEVSGVIGEQNPTLAQLGARVSAFNFAAFYDNANLLVSAGVAKQPGLLKFDSAALHAALTAAVDAQGQPTGGPLLFALRAENVKALLDQAVKSRENSFYKKFVRLQDVFTLAQNFFLPAKPDVPPKPDVTKPDRLEALAQISKVQHDALDTAYQADATMKGVVQTTSAEMSSSPSTTFFVGDTVVGSNVVTNLKSVLLNPTGGKTTMGIDVGSAVVAPVLPLCTVIASVDSAGNTVTLSKNAVASAAGVTFGSGVVNSSSTSQDAKGNPTTTTNSWSFPVDQYTETKGYTFRHPTFENDAQNHRAQASLLDERFKQFIYSQHVPHLDVMLTNESDSNDLDVKRLQVSYMNTILMSPIDGVVTGLFCNPGDCVQAGQPVMRVERDDVILLVGTIKYRSLLQVGSAVTITTTLFDGAVPTVPPTNPPSWQPAQPVQLPPGTIVAIRGHNHEDELWDVIIQCKNVMDAKGNPTIPINYNFDYDDTSLTVG